MTAPPTITVVDPQRRPHRVAPGHPLYGKSDALLRTEAVEHAADMEMGYYVGADGQQWPPRPFVIAELLSRIGYARTKAAVSGRRPSWWPGTDAMRRMVSLKILLRQAQRMPADGEAPWVDAALAAAAEELLRRLYVEPTAIASRELVDLTTKLARMREERRAKGEDKGRDRSGGTVVFQSITQTILDLPVEEQARARAAYERAIEHARAALPERIAEPAQ